jgi:uncharacterized Zn finger protein
MSTVACDLCGRPAASVPSHATNGAHNVRVTCRTCGHVVTARA